MRTKKNEATIKKNHMDVLWHEYTDKKDLTPITGASLSEKASVIGRVGIMMLACGTGAWRVPSVAKLLTSFSRRFSCDVFTPVLVRHKD